MISRLHPLLVHLPIGFIVMAFLLETYVFVKKPKDSLTNAINYIYLGAIAASILAVSTGLLLAENGKFTPSDLQVHKWLGIAVLVISTVVYANRKRGFIKAPRQSYLLSAFLILTVSVAGHFGGTLTHGPDYLFENAPRWIKKLAGVPAQPDLTGADTDSIVVYRDMIQPIMDQKCSRCHNAKYPSGGLITTDYSHLINGGDDLPGVVPRKPYESGILLRPSLPTDDNRFMPPDGEVLGHTEFAVLKYWIEQGADSAMQFDSKKLPEALKDLLLRDFKLDYTPRPHYLKLEADSIAPTDLIGLRSAGFEVDLMGDGIYFLDVRFKGDTLAEHQLQLLMDISDNLVRLDLSACYLSDSTLHAIGSFPNITFLDLNSTNVVDTAMTMVTTLQYLEVLNVFNTPLTSAGLETACLSPALETIYLWQTKATEDQVVSLKQRHPRINIVGGSVLKVFSDSTLTENDRRG